MRGVMWCVGEGSKEEKAETRRMDTVRCARAFLQSQTSKSRSSGGLLVVGLGGASWVLRLRAMPVARIPRA